MTKSEFILSLTEALSQLPGSERGRILEYYEEMIDDRIESGMNEEEAVAAMGSIDDILKETAPEVLNGPQPKHTESSQPLSAVNTSEFFNPIENLSINSGSTELHVLNAELPKGMTARVDCNITENEECICTLENGTLKVQYKNQKNQGFSLRKLFSFFNSSITVTLNNPALVRGEIAAKSGNIHLNGLIFTDSFDAGAASGDIQARDIAVHNKCSLHTASGNIEARNLTCGEHLDVHTVSGDIDLFDVRAGKISVGAASGDPTLGSIECDELEANSASGDIDMRSIQSGKIFAGTASGDVALADTVCSGSIELKSASGDIEIRKARCAEDIRLSSTSGDIDGSLQPTENYTFVARSRTGDVHVPSSNGPCTVEIHTNSGDVNFR